MPLVLKKISLADEAARNMAAQICCTLVPSSLRAWNLLAGEIIIQNKHSHTDVCIARRFMLRLHIHWAWRNRGDEGGRGHLDEL